MEVTYNGKVSDERLETLKRTHGDVYTLEVPENDEATVMAVGYLKRPDRILLGAVLNKQKVNSIAAKELLLNSTWLDGDARIKTNDDLFLSACTVLDDFFSVRESSLKKN